VGVGFGWAKSGYPGLVITPWGISWWQSLPLLFRGEPHGKKREGKKQKDRKQGYEIKLREAGLLSLRSASAVPRPRSDSAGRKAPVGPTAPAGGAGSGRERGAGGPSHPDGEQRAGTRFHRGEREEEVIINS